jgi:hypothetical protein
MGSSIPGARTNLQALLEAEFSDQPNVQVYYGKHLSQFVSPQTVQILGWTGDQEPAELGPSYRREETFQIHCEIVSWAADDDFPSRETEVMALFDSISLIVGNNPTLPPTYGATSGGAVRYAEVGSFTFTPDMDASGHSSGTLQFAVHCSQRVTSLT